MKDIRLLPLVIVAIGALFALRGVELMFGDASLLGGDGPAMAQDAAGQDAAGQDPAASPEPAQDMPDASADGSQGQAGGEPTDAAPAADAATGDQAAGETGGKPKGAAVLGQPRISPEEAKAGEPTLFQRVLGGESRSREALMESLAERRQQLEAREKELDLRENLLKAAEQRVEQRIAELKELEASIKAITDQRDAEEQERMKNVVTMYENMKPKDAARIFNELDMSIVSKVASMMSARQMSLVMAEMESPVAQRLTLELSARQVDPIAAVPQSGELPQIVGTRPAN